MPVYVLGDLVRLLFILTVLELNQLAVEHLRILLADRVQLLGVLVLCGVRKFDACGRVEAVRLRWHLDAQTLQVDCLL